MSEDRAERLRNADDALGVMFPGATVNAASAANAATARTDGRRSFAVLPSARHPRLLVPLEPRSGAAAALRAYGGRLRPVDRISYSALANGLGVTAGHGLRARFRVSGGLTLPGIDDHLSTVVGRPVSIAAHLTPARANRKPIVQALAAGERYPVAFAKLATNALTTDLVAAEAAALDLLADRDTGDVTVPRRLDAGEFNGRLALVMEPLPTWSRGRLPTPDELQRAATAIAAVVPAVTVPLASSTFWLRLRETVQLVQPAERRDALARTADRLEQAAGSVEVTLGAAHGDWSPWNMWHTSAGLLVWDWERFTTDTPTGSDLVHYQLQELLMITRAQRLTAARQTVAAAPSRLVACLHLLALAVRYDADDQTAAGSGMPASAEWLLPAVDEAAVDGRLTVGHAA